MNTIIKNGTIIDGTGSERYKADLLISDHVISKIGSNLNFSEIELVDASEMLVSPGFIDMHSHADLKILELNKAEAYLRQGVTTIVGGMCGLGLAPANDFVRKYYTTLVKSIIGSSEFTLFDTLDEFIREIEKKGISPNLALFIPHGNVRMSVMGMDDRAPSVKQLDAMKDMIRDGMEAGAFGMSTGLIYPPGNLSKTEELIELSKIVSEYDGIYDSHMRNEALDVIKIGMGELVKISKNSNVQAQISHWKTGINSMWDLTKDMINYAKEARNGGLKIYADVYPYEESSTSLVGILLESWVYKDFRGNLSKDKTRKRILEEIVKNLSSVYFSKVSSEITSEDVAKLIFAYLKRKIRIISVLHNHNIEGLKLGKALKILYPNVSFPDALLNFMRDEEGSIMISIKQMHERKGILPLLKQDFVCIGSDGFLVKELNTHPRSYGTFPRILCRYVREKKMFSFEEAIRKMTSLPAKILGLKSRGKIQEGYFADLVIFDPNYIEDMATYANGRQFPRGIKHVFVNGKITVKDSKH
ncbi:MAG: amidohydrolase family protein [Candidatus Lokiarchaeota archaeon]|nr:amidohydrolase family protein [Candidatus Lokiarchaeota archaeon]MBD3341037.1 amidohydrolase family protein [Candidatus Lokiarchaeota archaeon]